ncbi:MAG: carboxypeptidase regulatory-like domain-containing protein, partial [Bacteroidota bacterium]|nr:carboxypeptidase regulatory-like domain-containing protein [Candidatus Kapabacteria bacterium]MDW8221260.1 carboxypeptidase regulatory-like domain-containing protein [Bacteroidota bacterium]
MAHGRYFRSSNSCIAFTVLLCWYVLWQPAVLRAEQQTALYGKVLDKRTGQAVQGARVQLILDTTPRSSVGAITLRDGTFELKDLKPGTYRLTVSAPLYKTLIRTESIGEHMSSLEAEPLILELIPDIRGLDEVVVTGLASRTQKSVAEIAVARIDAAALAETQSFHDITQMLTGKVAGVSIAPASGNVGGGVRFVVRSGGGLYGTGQPVIFV